MSGFPDTAKQIDYFVYNLKTKVHNYSCCAVYVQKMSIELKSIPFAASQFHWRHSVSLQFTELCCDILKDMFFSHPASIVSNKPGPPSRKRLITKAYKLTLEIFLFLYVSVCMHSQPKVDRHDIKVQRRTSYTEGKDEICLNLLLI